MLQLIFHAIGDYLIQNDWMALNKKLRTWKGELACQIHCITYALPFKFICSWQAVAVIYVTHYLIDRFNFVGYFLAFRNGMWKLNGVDHNDPITFDTSNFGFGLDRPNFITIWLYIITDNIFHIICNYIAIRYL